MHQVWFIGFVATFLGVGIGGVIVYFINGFKRGLGTIYALCAGLILGLISFGIAPEALRLGNWIILVLGFLAGTIVFTLIHATLPTKLVSRPEMKTSLFLMLIISLHNFPIGVILGANIQSDVSHSLLQILILHNIPEGMILFAFVNIAGFRFLPFVLISFIVSVPVATGVLIGEMMGLQNTYVWSFIISLTVGMIYMVTMKEILPESIRRSSNIYSVLVAGFAFFLVGCYLLYL